VLRSDEARERFVEVRQRGGQSPHLHGFDVLAQSRQGELDLHAALGRHQLVPFVDDDGMHRREALAPIGVRQQQRQALGRGHEDRRQLSRLA
jgi:hypothetical protein